MSPTVPPTSTDNHIGVAFTRYLADAPFDLIGDVGNDLYGAPKIVSTTFFGDHFGVDLAGSDVGSPGQRFIDEAFVVAKV